MSRTRSRSSTNARLQYYTDSCNGTNEHGFSSWARYPVNYSDLGMGGFIEETTDWVTPNFKKSMQDGNIICNPFCSTKVTTSYSSPAFREFEYYLPNGYWCSAHNTYHNKIWKEHGPQRALASLLDLPGRSALRTSVIDAAVTKANANIDTSEMLGLATVAESRKTVDSMFAILLRCYKIARDVRHFRLKSLAGQVSPKELADRYMEARYALRPLAYDARGICKAVQRNSGMCRRTFNGSDTGSITDTLTTDWATHSYMLESKYSKTSTYEVSARSGVLCDVTLSNISAFGLDQLLETTWELLPYSFIVDWFCNAGDWIAAHTPNVGVNKRASWVTVRSLFTQFVQLADYRSISGSYGYTTTKIVLGPYWQKREELVLERIVNPELNGFVQGNLRLDQFKLLDLGIIIRNLFAH